MNILLVGGSCSLINSMILKLRKEGHRIFLLTGDKYRHNKYERVFEKYEFSYDCENLNDILESVNADVTILMGAFDTNYCWDGEEREIVLFISHLVNILVAYSVKNKKRLIFLSSDEIYNGNYTEDIKEEEPFSGVGIRADALSQAEEICDNFRINRSLDIITLRLDHLYNIPKERKDVNNICADMCLNCMCDGHIKAKTDHTFSLLYENDAVEYIYQFIKTSNHKYSLYNLSSNDVVSEVKLAAMIQKAMEIESNIVAFSDSNGRCVLSGNRFEREFGVHAFGNLEKNIKDMVSYMKKHESVFLKGDDLKLSWWKMLYEKWKWLIRTLFPFFENLVCFVPFFMMNNRTVGSEYFANLDPFLLYVLLFAIVYLEAYLNNVADDDTKVKYSSVLPDTVDQIYSNFKTALKEECDRPLFVAVYTELWIYKDGCISVTSLDEMLAAFLKREEDRWLLCLDNHSNLLKDYVKLLALASASVLVCLDDDQGIYQQAAQNLQQYINASQRPGKKQTDFSDLFVYQEYAHDYEMDEVSTLEEIQEEILRRANDPKYLRLDEKGCSKLLTIIAPEYPDIIKEFLVDYYIPKYEWIGFSQAARLGTVTQFDMFLLHAIEDFPDKKSYMEMEFAPLEDERDRFGQWIFVILAAKNLNNFEQIADNLCVSQAPEIICAYEMEVWKDIGIVLTDRGELDRLYTLGLRSADYITDRLDNDVVCECIEEVWDAFFIGVHNAELTQQTANLMDKYNQIADKIAENGYIATWCTENYARLMLLWLRRNDYRSAANCWKQMMKFQQRFADDEDILKAIAGAADALYDIYRENQVPGRRCKLLKDMERIFDETHNADVANALAILEANEHTIYDPPAVFDSNKSEILLSTENKLKEIYEVFPNEGKVVLGYSYLVSWNYVTWLDFPRPIDEELIPLFKKWIRKFPENKLELMEYYSFILFEKWLYMDSLDNISEANKIYYEIKAIADELSKDYADNQVTQMLSMGIVRKL